MGAVGCTVGDLSQMETVLRALLVEERRLGGVVEAAGGLGDEAGAAKRSEGGGSVLKRGEGLQAEQ